MQIVINKCFGGFNLSHEAVMRYAQLSGFKLYAYVNKRNANGGLMFDQYEEYVPADGERPFVIHYRTAPLVDGVGMNDSYFTDRDIKRNDPMLVKVVKDLGTKANGMCAKLAVVDVPNDIEWEISEYDGMESVEEVHRSWS